jgi:hypothetical protein
MMIRFPQVLDAQEATSMFNDTGLAATVLDARGRQVPLVPHDWKLHFLRDTDMGHRLRASSDLVREKTTGLDIRRGIAFGILALPILLLAASAPAYLAFSLKWPLGLMLLAAIPLGVLPALVTIFVVRRATTRRIANVYAHAGFCGSCGHDLRGATTEPDGCTICTECGAAWRVGTDPQAPIASASSMG